MSLFLNKKCPVRVSADEAGSIISQSSNPEYGYIRVVQEKPVDKDGFVKFREVSALIQGTIEDLQKLDLKAGDELEGKIIVKESLVPFNMGNPQRDLKVAGTTGIPCTLDGEPIYRKTVYTSAANAEDSYIEHDNIEELRAAYNLSQSSKASIEEDFNL